MHQHDEAQPFGLGNDDLGDAAGDESVQQDDRAVRQVTERTGEFRAGGGRGTRPAARDGVPVDLPAEAGQVQAEPPVVGVAAARRGRVVDTARHDEVHGAQGHGDDLGVLGGRVLRGHVAQGGLVTGQGYPVHGRVGHKARS